MCVVLLYWKQKLIYFLLNPFHSNNNKSHHTHTVRHKHVLSVLMNKRSLTAGLMFRLFPDCFVLCEVGPGLIVQSSPCRWYWTTLDHRETWTKRWGPFWHIGSNVASTTCGGACMKRVSYWAKLSGCWCWTSIYRLVGLSIHPSIYLSIHPSGYPFIHLSIYPSIYISILNLTVTFISVQMWVLLLKWDKKWTITSEEQKIEEFCS